MWAEDIDDITVEYEEDGVLVVKQEDRRVISRGTWPVLAFLYREWDAAANAYGPAKVTLRKFRKQHGSYRMESKFNIGQAAQAAAIADILREWAGTVAGQEPEETPVSRRGKKSG